MIQIPNNMYIPLRNNEDDLVDLYLGNIVFENTLYYEECHCFICGAEIDSFEKICAECIEEFPIV